MEIKSKNINKKNEKWYRNLPLNFRESTLTGIKNFFLEVIHLLHSDKPPPGTIQCTCG